jgi:hypothetical protein
MESPEYIRIFNKYMNHMGFQYKYGYNEDIHKFNPNFYTRGGLHFAEKKNFYRFLSFGDRIADVIIPDGARVEKIYEDAYCGYIYKADKIIIKNIRLVKNLPEWKDEAFQKKIIEAGEDNAYEYFRNPSLEVQKMMIKTSSYCIKYIKKPSREIQLMAVHDDINNVKYINNPCSAVQLYVVRIKPSLSYLFKKPSEQVQKIIAKKDARFLKHIKNVCKSAQLIVIKNNPANISYIKNPSYSIQMELATKHPKILLDNMNRKNISVRIYKYIEKHHKHLLL